MFNKPLSITKDIIEIHVYASFDQNILRFGSRVMSIHTNNRQADRQTNTVIIVHICGPRNKFCTTSSTTKIYSSEIPT